MKTYRVSFSTDLEVRAHNEDEAYDEAVERIAHDPEILMPGNMTMGITTN